ncbi:MAG: NADPH-dependent FMN reductase [Burkholderiaceae bacterium]
MANFKVLGICGSLRAKSINRHALRAASEVMPEGMQMTIANIDAIPLFNQDVQDAGMPAAVLALAAEVRGADALLIASPEYNFSVSGVLKNAIDWLSRVPEQPFKDKPAAILSASPGPMGGGRHQYELRKILGCLEAVVLTKPEVFINLAGSKFDAEGNLADAASRKAVTDQMAAFARWIGRVALKP